VAYQQNKPEQAKELIERAVAMAPDSGHAQASLGRLLAIRRQYAEAEVALRRAAALEPFLVPPRMDLADLYATALQRPRDAVTLYREVLSFAPKHAGARYALGVVLGRLGEADAARAELQAAAELEPANPLPPLALATLLARGGDRAGALSAADRALKLQPNLVAARELRGDLLLAGGDDAGALAEYEAAAATKQPSASALFKAGMLQQKAKRLDAAERYYRRAIEADANSPASYNNLAWLAVERGRDLPQAENWAKRAVELAPSVPAYLDTLAWVYRAQGRLPDAEVTLTKAIAMDGATADLHYRLGIVLQEQNKRQAATDAYRQALTKQPDHRAAKHALEKLGAAKR
jgi:tetratricopeptide (TPR) repeat protein